MNQVAAPAGPKNHPDAKELVTEDCIRTTKHDES